MNTRGVYLSSFYRPVVLINLCLNSVFHSADLFSESRRSQISRHFSPSLTDRVYWFEFDLIWPLSLRSLALTPIQRPEMYIIGAQPLCSQLSGLSQVSSPLFALDFYHSHCMNSMVVSARIRAFMGFCGAQQHQY